MPDRHTMTPAEFDAACRELVRKCPTLSETSGHRSPDRNAAVGGSPESKHLCGLARDFVDSDDVYGGPAGVAKEIGFWIAVHDKGSGNHLHVQGAATGPLPDWWLEKYWHE